MKRPLGRPPSKIQKITIALRIPPEVNTYLNEYSAEHELPKGEVVARAVLLFQLREREKEMSLGGRSHNVSPVDGSQVESSKRTIAPPDAIRQGDPTCI